MFCLSESTDEQTPIKWAFSDTLPHWMFVEIVEHINDVHRVSYATMGRLCGSKAINKQASSMIRNARYQYSGGRNRYNPTIWAPRAREMLDKWCDCVRE